MCQVITFVLVAGVFGVTDESVVSIDGIVLISQGQPSGALFADSLGLRLHQRATPSLLYLFHLVKIILLNYDFLLTIFPFNVVSIRSLIFVWGFHPNLLF